MWIAIDKCPAEWEKSAFHYVLVKLPWELAFKHGRVQYSRLAEVLAKTPKLPLASPPEAL